MIYNSQFETASGETADLSRVMNEIDEICPRDPELLHRARSVAEGVAAYICGDVRNPTLKSRHLRVMISRALHAAGEEELARRVLLFGGGLVRRSSSIVVRDPLWVLDLECLAMNENERMDMLVSVTLSTILETMAGAWDETRGRGTLGLRSVEHMARTLSGGNATRRKVCAAAEEIRALCRDRLMLMKRRRGWEECPQVMEMDGK